MCRIRFGLRQPVLHLWCDSGQPCMPANTPQHLFLHVCHLYCLCVRCLSLNMNMIDSRRVLYSFDCGSAPCFFTSHMESWQRTIAATQAERPAKRRNSNAPAPGNKDDLERQLLFISTRLGLTHELPMEPRAKVEPVSGKHSVQTYFPKDPNCDICLKTKITKASCRRRAGTVVPRTEHVGDLINSGSQSSQ